MSTPLDNPPEADGLELEDFKDAEYIFESDADFWADAIRTYGVPENLPDEFLYLLD